jgi:hypothetical protein
MKPLLLIFLLSIPGFVRAQWATVNTAHTRHTNTGNVGIGTASGITPADKLEVIGNTRSNQFNAVNGVFNVQSTSNMLLQTNGINRFTILNSNGYVGVNTTSPVETLHVNGNIRSNQITTINGLFASLNPANLTMQTNGAARLTILNSNGYVGIGTTSPAYMLDVNGSVNATSQMSIACTIPAGYKLAVGGKIIAEEVVLKLQANWPDYVFEKDYKLPSFEELQLFIAQHKHLPGVPSANQVQDNGISVAEMNSILLKKIEELTLYIIELKKENEKQEAAIKVLADKK